VRVAIAWRAGAGPRDDALGGGGLGSAGQTRHAKARTWRVWAGLRRGETRPRHDAKPARPGRICAWDDETRKRADSLLAAWHVAWQGRRWAPLSEGGDEVAVESRNQQQAETTPRWVTLPRPDAGRETDGMDGNRGLRYDSDN